MQRSNWVGGVLSVDPRTPGVLSSSVQPGIFFGDHKHPLFHLDNESYRLTMDITSLLTGLYLEAFDDGLLGDGYRIIGIGPTPLPKDVIVAMSPEHGGTVVEFKQLKDGIPIPHMLTIQNQPVTALFLPFLPFDGNHHVNFLLVIGVLSGKLEQTQELQQLSPHFYQLP